MKAKILSNKKLFILIGIAVALFAAVNVAWWINANANQSDNGRTVYKGHHIEGDKYEFVQGDNLPDMYLDSDHQPNHIIKHYYKDLNVSDDNNIAWLKGEDGHSWVDSTYYFGGSEEEGSRRYRFHDFEFIVSDYLEDGVGHYKTNRIGVVYEKQSPQSSKAQGARFYFKLDCYDENGNYLATKRTWDGFKDVSDSQDNGDVLERAGHSRDHGDLFEDALNLVGYENLCNAIIR